MNRSVVQDIGDTVIPVPVVIAVSGDRKLIAASLVPTLVPKPGSPTVTQGDLRR